METSIKSCTCTHSYQDDRHGDGRRVHNKAVSAKNTGWRCTVCSKVKAR